MDRGAAPGCVLPGTSESLLASRQPGGAAALRALRQPVPKLSISRCPGLAVSRGERSLYVARRRPPGHPNQCRAARLTVVAICLAGAAVYFRHGIRLGADGPNYFIQARSLLFDGDIDFGNEIERVAGVVPGMPERAMGLPLASMPFLALTHLALKLGELAGLDLVADGFGYPYETAFGLASYIVGALGLIAMLRVAFRFFASAVALLSVLTVGTSSFLAWYMVVEPAMPHAASAASVAFAVSFWMARRPLTGT